MDIVKSVVTGVTKAAFDKWREINMANKLEELKELIMESDLYPKKQEKKTETWVIVLAVIGIIAAVAAIAAAVYFFLIPEDSEDFEDFEDMDDDFDDDFSDEDDLEGDE